MPELDVETRLARLDAKVNALIQRGQGRIFTFSIVVGTKACDGKCPFCVSSCTGYDELPKHDKINEIRLRKAARLAQIRGATTVLFTGKGEPTLYPTQIYNYLRHLKSFDFPNIELQTNALQIGRLATYGQTKGPLTEQHLQTWLENGVNTIAISVVDVDDKNNQAIYAPTYYPPLQTTIKYLHGLGFSVRLCVMMHRGMVDSAASIDRVVRFCKENAVEQCTIRPIRKPTQLAKDADGFARYIDENGLPEDLVQLLRDYVRDVGTHLLTIAHGAHAALVYDVRGQNLCVSDCLTVESTTDDIRTLIYFADGKIRFDWQYDGAVIM